MTPRSVRTSARPAAHHLRVARLTRLLTVAGPTARAIHQRELVALYQAHPEVRPAVVEALIPLARTLVRSVRGGAEAREDLDQLAMVGLLLALERFDDRRGATFAAFAAPTIHGVITRHLRDTGWAVHVPRQRKELALAVGRLERAEGPQPDGTLARVLATTEAAVGEARCAMAARYAEASVAGAEDDRGYVDAGFELADARAAIASMSAGLADRDREVLARAFVANESQRQIGARFGISQMQVSRITRRALEDMRFAATTDEADRPGHATSAIRRPTCRRRRPLYACSEGIDAEASGRDI